MKHEIRPFVDSAVRTLHTTFLTHVTRCMSSAAGLLKHWVACADHFPSCAHVICPLLSTCYPLCAAMKYLCSAGNRQPPFVTM